MHWELWWDSGQKLWRVAGFVIENKCAMRVGILEGQFRTQHDSKFGVEIRTHQLMVGLVGLATRVQDSSLVYIYRSMKDICPA